MDGNGDTSDEQALSLSESDMDATVNAVVNREIEIKLQTIGAGEYSSPRISSESVRFLNEVVPAAQNPGGISQNFLFRAEGVGTAVVTIPHTVRSRAYEVTIVVE